MTDLDSILEVVAKDFAEFTASFDIYCLNNMEQVLGLIYSEGYNQHDNAGLGGLEQYENDNKFSIYPGETLFYHLLQINKTNQTTVKP